MSQWKTYRPSDSKPWNVQRVVHLHRRAAFAANWYEIQRDLESGPDAAINRLLSGHKELAAANDFESMSRNIANAATSSNNSARLKAWWFYRMLKTPDPLGERLTLMWHNHFATSNRKVDNLVWMLQQNEIIRANARGPFANLLRATLKHPAMLKWLDAEANRKGHANENLGRELLELFTLGIGNYTEADVQSAARALTGWMIVENDFAYRQSRHDDGVFRFLGKVSKLDGDALLQRTANHPATAKRIAWRICKTFMAENAYDESAVEALAAVLAGQDLDIGHAVGIVLRSDKFFADQNMRTRVTGPAEHVVGAFTALELTDPPPSTLRLGEWSSRMGQDVFYPPNVGGWNEGRTWLGSRAIIARCNFGNAIATGQLWRSRNTASIESSLESLLNRHNVGSDIQARASWVTTLLWGAPSQQASKDVISQIGKSKTPLADIVGQLLARAEHQLS